MKSKQVQEFKETEIGKIPADWEVEKLRNLLTTDLRHGIYKSKEFVNPDGVKILKMGILDSTNWIGEQKMERFSVNDEELKKFKIHEGNIIFARTSMMTGGLGNCGIVMKHNEPIVFDGNLLCAELNTDLISPFFCLYYFKSKYGQDEISRMTGGTQSRSIPSSELSKVLVILPSKSEQIKISKILFNMDTQIQNLQNQNCVLEQMAQAIFQSWFVDFDGVTEFEGSELGKIPKGWSVGNLGDICEIIMGSSPPGKSYNEVGDGIIFFQGNTDFTDFFPTPRMYCSMPKRFAEKNDVLFTVRAPVGSINVAKEKYCIGRGLASLRLKENHGCFLYFFLKYLEGKWNKFEADGTVFGSINKDDLSEFKLVISPTELRIKFNNIIKPIYNLIWDNNLNYQSLTKTRDILLPKLMSGEIRV